MSFNPNIPLVNDFMVQSQQQCKANFQAIFNAFAQNHKALNQENQGMHNTLTFIQQPDPTTSSLQVTLYTKSVGGIPNLFFNPSNSGTPIQLTYPSLSTGLQSTNPDVYKAQQYTFIAGPFVVYGGFIPTPTKAQVITLTPSTTLIYVDLTAAEGVVPNINPTIAATNISGNSFSIDFQNGLFPQGVYYLAIGK